MDRTVPDGPCGCLEKQVKEPLQNPGLDNELASRVARMGSSPKIRPLEDAIVQMGRLYESIEAIDEPVSESSLPAWMMTA